MSSFQKCQKFLYKLITLTEIGPVSEDFRLECMAETCCPDEDVSHMTFQLAGIMLDKFSQQVGLRATLRSSVSELKIFISGRITKLCFSSDP